MTKLTSGKLIAALLAGERMTLEKVEPCGSLYAKKRVNGSVMLYWRYSHGTYNKSVLIGAYDSSAPPQSIQRSKIGFSIKAAIREAEVHARLHMDNKSDGGYRQVEDDRAKKKKLAKAEMTDRQEQTLGKLLLAYCDYLEKLNRNSHREARSVFSVHIFGPWPNLVSIPAADITTEQIADTMRLVHEKGLGRTSNKLRSYLRAAYQVAKSSKTKASIPIGFKAFLITNNPVSETEPDTTENKSDKDPLTETEMNIYWSCIKSLDSFKGAVLRFHLLTGGLRIEQLVRLKTNTIKDDTFTLIDLKGRPGGGSRPYTTPLLELSKKALNDFKPTGEYAISTQNGKTHLAATTLSKWAREAVGEKIKNFHAKRIRSGVETLLAKKGFSKDWRGRLQSHGISGVQDRHYDGYDYVIEKRKLLLALENAFQLTNPID